MHPAARKTLVCFNEFTNGSKFSIGRRATGGKQYYPDALKNNDGVQNRHVAADGHIFGNEGAKLDKITNKGGKVGNIDVSPVERDNSIKPVRLKASDVGPGAAGKAGDPGSGATGIGLGVVLEPLKRKKNKKEKNKKEKNKKEKNKKTDGVKLDVKRKKKDKKKKNKKAGDVRVDAKRKRKNKNKRKKDKAA